MTVSQHKFIDSQAYVQHTTSGKIVIMYISFLFEEWDTTIGKRDLLLIIDAITHNGSVHTNQPGLAAAKQSCKSASCHLWRVPAVS